MRAGVQMNGRRQTVSPIARVAALRGRAIPTTAIVARTLTSSWLVEIEVLAAA